MLLNQNALIIIAARDGSKRPDEGFVGVPLERESPVAESGNNFLYASTLDVAEIAQKSPI